MNGHYSTDSRELPKNGSVKARIQTLKEPLSQWLSIATGRGVLVSGPMLKSQSEELAKELRDNDFKATDGCPDGKAGFGKNSRRHMARRAVLMLQVLNNGNPQNCQTCFRNFVQMISTMPLKQMYFICHARQVPKLQTQLCRVQREQ
jgi:hypothetical protein